MKRICEVCKSKNVKKVYTQKFLVSGYQKKSLSYDVVTCSHCGFAFAENPPSEKKLANFYKKNLKYAYKTNRGSVPEYAQQLHAASFNHVDSYLEKKNPDFNKRDCSILDIGCGSGYLLHVFKKNGYENAMGLDPAADCRRIGRELYDVEIETATLSEYDNDQKFDLILLASVLEHMSNLSEVISKLRLLIKPDGLLFITVPDGDNFGVIMNEPFLEFSLEHINFFTRNSISNLLNKNGFKNVAFESMPVEGYGGYALNSLWKPSQAGKNKIKQDGDGEAKISQYVAKSSSKLSKVEKIIQKLIKTNEEVVVWGAGSLTSRLLATTNLAKANILFFIDSNLSLQGTKINSIEIAHPNILKGNETVLISSYIHGKEIKKMLLEDYGHSGKIITLD